MSEAFKQAVIDSKKLTAKPSNDELLELYGTSRPESHSILNRTTFPLQAVTAVLTFLSPQPSSRSPTARTSPRPPSPACST